ARVMAAGEMDVHRAVELDPPFAPARDLLGVPFCIGSRELATDIAGAGDEAGADRARAGRQPESLDGSDRFIEAARRNAGDQQILPDREPDVAITGVARDHGEPA